jgi:hypothetical protein
MCGPVDTASAPKMEEAISINRYIICAHTHLHGQFCVFKCDDLR